MLFGVRREHEASGLDRSPQTPRARDETQRIVPIIKKLIFFVLCFFSLFSPNVWTQILSHEVTGLKRDFYSPKDVCETMGHKHSLMVSAKPPASVDCMGRVVVLTDFCQKIEKRGLALLRGRLDPLTNQVICEYGDGLIFSMRCHSGNSQYCESAQEGCLGIQNVFAKELSVSHAALLPDGGDHRLNCYFTHSSLNLDVQKILPPLSEVESL